MFSLKLKMKQLREKCRISYQFHEQFFDLRKLKNLISSLIFLQFFGSFPLFSPVFAQPTENLQQHITILTTVILPLAHLLQEI